MSVDYEAPNGHVTMPIGAIHCFCWPSLSMDVCLEYFVFLEVNWIILWNLLCGKASVCYYVFSG